MEYNTASLRRTTGGGEIEAHKQRERERQNEKKIHKEKEGRERGKKGEERAQVSRTARRSKKSAMWIVVNDRVQLNEGM